MKTLPLEAADSFKTDHEVARFLGLSVRTIQNWRFVNRGPRYIKIGRTVRYRQEDISAFLATMPSRGNGVWGLREEE
ncbi:MAG: helix-turn-helix transcriptional regulator [Bryobacteraceae bacterium]|jgi:predicted DNA-binding transcriptional regulator AlpA